MPVFIVGDVHGHLNKLRRLLMGVGLVGEELSWTGGPARLWLMGDLVDNGPDSIGVLDAVMRLQGEAAAAGGGVGVLLGNHDFLIAGARRFPEHIMADPRRTWLEDWWANGGQEPDRARLTQAHLAWLTALPALACEGDTLLAHADSPLYSRYGASIPEVNQNIRAVVAGDDPAALESLLLRFGEQRAFVDSRPDGGERLRAFLAVFGARRLVHGHTPIGKITGQSLDQLTGPLIYAGGQAVDVDGGMAKGGAGFVYAL
jgi:hypothetical protein